MEIGVNECRDSVVIDRFNELHDDMNNGFSKLRKNVEEMDADELRREMSLLMMIGSTQMDTVRRLRRDVEEMDRDLHRLHVERDQFERASRELADAMVIPFDPDDFSPAKLVRTASTVARKYAERHTETFEPEITSDRRGRGVEVALIVALSVLVLCVVVWTAIMVETWL